LDSTARIVPDKTKEVKVRISLVVLEEGGESSSSLDKKALSRAVEDVVLERSDLSLFSLRDVKDTYPGVVVDVVELSSLLLCSISDDGDILFGYGKGAFLSLFYEKKQWLVDFRVALLFLPFSLRAFVAYVDQHKTALYYTLAREKTVRSSGVRVYIRF